MSQNLKDCFQIGAWAIAIIGGLITAYKAVKEMQRSNEQRREDMRWKQAEMAKKCLDEIFSNSQARAALRMLDWTGAIYAKPDGTKTGPIKHEERRVALRAKSTFFFPSGDDGPFIRDAYDELFDGFERLEHFIRIKLILFEDVKQPLSYYVGKLAVQEERVVIQPFLKEYGFQLAQDFLHRFPVWNEA